MDSITQMKTSLANASRKLKHLEERVSDAKNVTSALREILRCHECTEVPEKKLSLLSPFVDGAGMRGMRTLMLLFQE